MIIACCTIVECGIVVGYLCLGCDDAQTKEKGKILKGSRMESSEGCGGL
jgi:hypothetical protein